MDPNYVLTAFNCSRSSAQSAMESTGRFSTLCLHPMEWKGWHFSGACSPLSPRPQARLRKSIPAV